MVLSKEVAVQKGTAHSGSASYGEKVETPVFKVESIPPHYLCAVGNQSRFCGTHTSQHTNVAHEAIHFLNVECCWEEVWNQLSYQATKTFSVLVHER